MSDWRAVAAMMLLTPAALAGAVSPPAALERGVDFLLAAQQADGHFGDSAHPALTALPLWALKGSGRSGIESNLAAAAAFVLGTQRPDGGFYVPKPGRSGSGLGNYNTAVSLSALHDWGGAPRAALLRARDYLVGSQLTGEDRMAGGFGYDRQSRRRHADLSNTAYALSALRRTAALEELRPGGRRREPNWERAAKFVEGLLDEEGGAAYGGDTAQAGSVTNRQGEVRLAAYGSMSYAALLSMCAADLSRGDGRVRSTLKYVERHWTLDENPGMGHQGLYYFYDILARALTAAKVARVGEHDWKAELAAKLVALQRPDGSWCNDNNRFWEGDPILCTAFALLALEQTLTRE